jgi:uncharacterized protein (TIGR02270 family)
MNWSSYLPPSPPARDDLVWDVVEQHFDEAEFLTQWLQDTFEDPDYDAKECAAGPEARLFAHIEGLVLAGEACAQEMLRPALDPGAEPTRITAAALALLEHPMAAHGDLVFEAATPELARPIACALSWARRPDLDAWLQTRLGRAEPPAWPALLHACATRGLDPGPRLAEAFRSSEAETFAAALAAARWAPTRDYVHILDTLAGGESDLAVPALLGGLAVASRGAWQTAQRRAQRGDAAGLWALAAFGDPRARDWLCERLPDEAMREHVVFALGFSGRAQDVDALMPWLADEAVAKLAGEAVANIVGITTAQDEFWLESKAPEPPPPGDEELTPLEDDLAKPIDDPLASLLTPDAEVFARWWKDNRSRFAAGVRYLQGRSLEPGVALEQLHRGTSMRRRHWVALELAGRTRGQMACPTRLLPSLQIARLSAMPRVGGIDMQRAFGQWV